MGGEWRRGMHRGLPWWAFFLKYVFQNNCKVSYFFSVFIRDRSSITRSRGYKVEGGGGK